MAIGLRMAEISKMGIFRYDGNFILGENEESGHSIMAKEYDTVIYNKIFQKVNTYDLFTETNECNIVDGNTEKIVTYPIRCKKCHTLWYLSRQWVNFICFDCLLKLNK